MGGRKKEEIAKFMRTLGVGGSKPMDEPKIRAFIDDIPFRCMQDMSALSNYLRRKRIGWRDARIILDFIQRNEGIIRSIRVSDNIAYGSVVGLFEELRSKAIVLYVVNHIMHEGMLEVYSLLERERRLRFGVKKAVGNAQHLWDGYVSAHLSATDKSSWYTLQDYLSIFNDMVLPRREAVYRTIRDYMIALGCRDVELKARCCLALLLGKVAVTSFAAFFDDARKACGVDFSACFSDSDMQEEVKAFASVCDALGLKTKRDSGGMWCLDSFEPDMSLRFEWAWKEFMDDLRNGDLLDEGAEEAIALNPELERDYRRLLDEEERKKMENGLSRLGDKYRVGRI